MKKNYEIPTLELTNFSNTDVITTSIVDTRSMDNATKSAFEKAATSSSSKATDYASLLWD